MLTLSPVAKQQFFDNAGAVLAGGLLYTYAAGTSTAQATYTNSAGTVPNANPIQLDAFGRVPSGFFLLASAYKFVITTSAAVTLWSQDDIQPVPASSVDTVVDGTAGEALTANQCCYVSDGSGGLVAGRWYLADSDFTYASTLPQVGFAVTAVAAAAQGKFILVGRVTGLSALVAGSSYYVSATPGALTTTAPANSRKVGVADSLTTLVMTANPPVAVINYLTATNILANQSFG